jgi:hypothetical protein
MVFSSFVLRRLPISRFWKYRRRFGEKDARNHRTAAHSSHQFYGWGAAMTPNSEGKQSAARRFIFGGAALSILFVAIILATAFLGRLPLQKSAFRNEEEKVKTPHCPDCKCEMEVGFIPDFSYGTSSHSVLQTLWHPGDPESRKFLGFHTGNVKVEQSEARKIVSFRCPECGLLRSYAA